MASEQEEPDPDKRKQALAIKLGECVDGANLLEVAEVCARMLVFTVVQMPRSDAQKRNTMTDLFKFMRQSLKQALQRQHESDVAKH